MFKREKSAIADHIGLDKKKINENVVDDLLNEHKTMYPPNKNHEI